jgi:hypothetical protein
MLVNVGRGKHIVEKDLIAALDAGQLSYAALDALYPEPLPPDNPLWLHPKVTVMPHVARRPTVAQLVTEIAANIRSLKAGGGLLQEINYTEGTDRESASCRVLPQRLDQLSHRLPFLAAIHRRFDRVHPAPSDAPPRSSRNFARTCGSYPASACRARNSPAPPWRCARPSASA